MVRFPVLNDKVGMMTKHYLSLQWEPNNRVSITYQSAISAMYPVCVLNIVFQNIYSDAGNVQNGMLRLPTIIFDCKKTMKYMYHNKMVPYLRHVYMFSPSVFVHL